jgi:hypothetical protein
MHANAHQLSCQLCLVSIGLGSFDGQDDAIGDNGKKDGILEGRPIYEEFGQPSQEITLPEYEEGGGTLLLLLRLQLLFAAAHFDRLYSLGGRGLQPRAEKAVAARQKPQPPPRSRGSAASAPCRLTIHFAATKKSPHLEQEL